MTKQLQAVAHANQDVPRAERIARLNDALRKTGQGGAIMVTRGVRALPGFKVTALLLMLQTTDEFDIDNDPHGERDFGGLEWSNGAELLWRVDYYDNDMLYASPDPADPSVTQRALTVMLASEY